MRMRRRQSRVLALAASGLVFAGSGGCLPNDFLERFVGPARDSLIQALASNFIFNIADTIVPPPETATP